MPTDACPECGLATWHTHAAAAPVDLSVRLRDILDEWENQGEKLQIVEAAHTAIVARMEELRQMAASKGATLAPVSGAIDGRAAAHPRPVGYRAPPADVVIVGDDVDFESMATDDLQNLLRTKNVHTRSQEGVGATGIDSMGIPEAGMRGIVSNTGGTGKTAEQIEAEEQAQYTAESIATAAGWPRQRIKDEQPADDAAQRAQIAEIQSAAGEGMADDGRAFRQSTADRLAGFKSLGF